MTELTNDERGGLSSASSAERDHYCPGSVAAIRAIPEEQRPKKTAVAESGTRIHDAWERNDVSDLDMTEAEIKEALDRLSSECEQKWLTDFGIAKSERIIRETRFWVHDENLNPVTSAKLDLAYLSGDRGLAIDGKTGYLQTTPAQRNFQCKVQAVALAREFQLKYVRVVVAAHRFTSYVTAADYDEEALERAYYELLQDNWRTRQPDAPRNPGKHCAYCDAKAFCREAAVYANMPMVVATNAISSQFKTEALLESVERMQPADLVFVYNRMGIAQKIFDAVKDRLKAMPADQLRALGLELSEGRAMSEVKNAPALIEYCEREGLLLEDEVLGCFKLVIGRLEDKVIERETAAAKELNLKLTQKEAKQQFRAKCQENGWIDFAAGKSEGSLKEIEA